MIVGIQEPHDGEYHGEYYRVRGIKEIRRYGSGRCRLVPKDGGLRNSFIIDNGWRVIYADDDPSNRKLTESITPTQFARYVPENLA